MEAPCIKYWCHSHKCFVVFMKIGKDCISNEKLEAALAVPHINYLLSPRLTLDKAKICSNIILSNLIDCKVPILRLCYCIFDVLERVRCSSRICNPNVVTLVY